MANATSDQLDLDFVVLRIRQLDLIHDQGLAYFILYSCFHEFTLPFFCNRTPLVAGGLGKYPLFWQR
jgi:hypothetical protein